MEIRDTFHKLISYKFKNDNGVVRTAYLDTYFRDYDGRSGTYDYDLHQLAFLQFANYFIKHPLRFTRPQLQKIYQHLTNKAIEILFFYTIDIRTIIDDYNPRASYVHIFIDQVLQKYNRTIIDLEDLKRKLDNLPIMYIPTIRYQYPNPIHPYTHRAKILTHRKGHRGFVSEYQYTNYW